MPGEGGVCGVVVEAGLLAVLAVFAAGVLAGAEEAVVAGLAGAAAALVGVGVAGFDEFDAGVGLEVVLAAGVLLVELLELDLPDVDEEDVPAVGLVVLLFFDLDVLLVEDELLDELELPFVVCVLWASIAAGVMVPMSNAPSTRGANSFLA
jgi:hypothetical protein